MSGRYPGIWLSRFNEADGDDDDDDDNDEEEEEEDGKNNKIYGPQKVPGA